MIILTTNHKVGDEVYVVDDCVRRGIVKQVNFAQSDTAFVLSYDVLYDGFTFNTNVVSTVLFDVGSPIFGSPIFGSPFLVSSGSPFVGSPLLTVEVTVIETRNGGEIYTNKNTALTAFGDKLA